MHQQQAGWVHIQEARWSSSAQAAGALQQWIAAKRTVHACSPAPEAGEQTSSRQPIRSCPRSCSMSDGLLQAGSPWTPVSLIHSL